MIITWEVRDGYKAISEPITLEISDLEFSDSQSYERKKQIIMEEVQKEFDRYIGWNILDWGGLEP